MGISQELMDNYFEARRLKEESEEVQESALMMEREQTSEERKVSSISEGIIERSYLKSIEHEEKEQGEIRVGELSVALSVDPDNVAVLTIASQDGDLIEQFQSCIQNPHIERQAIIDLPPEDSDRIARIESVNVLNYLQKREKARQEEFERLENYESAISSGSV